MGLIQEKQCYTDFLALLEKQDEFKSVKRLCDKITRQRKELQLWLRSKQKKEEVENPKEDEQEIKLDEEPQAPAAEEEKIENKDWS